MKGGAEIYDGILIRFGMTVEGPSIVEQENSTIVVPPKQTLKANKYGDFVLGIG